MAFAKTRTRHIYYNNGDNNGNKNGAGGGGTDDGSGRGGNSGNGDSGGDDPSGDGQAGGHFQQIIDHNRQAAEWAKVRGQQTSSTWQTWKPPTLPMWSCHYMDA